MAPLRSRTMCIRRANCSESSAPVRYFYRSHLPLQGSLFIASRKHCHKWQLASHKNLQKCLPQLVNVHKFTLTVQNPPIRPNDLLISSVTHSCALPHLSSQTNIHSAPYKRIPLHKAFPVVIRGFREHNAPPASTLFITNRRP